MVLQRAPLGHRGSYPPTVLNIAQCLGWSVFELIVIATAAARSPSSCSGSRRRWLWTLALRRAHDRARAARAGRLRAALRAEVRRLGRPRVARLPDVVDAPRGAPARRSGHGTARAACRSGPRSTSCWRASSPGRRSSPTTRASRGAGAAPSGARPRLPRPDALALRVGALLLLSRGPRPTPQPSRPRSPPEASRRCSRSRAHRRRVGRGVRERVLDRRLDPEPLPAPVAAAPDRDRRLRRDHRRTRDRPSRLPAVPVSARLVLRAPLRRPPRRLDAHRTALRPGRRVRRARRAPAGIVAWLAGFSLYQWIQPVGPGWWTGIVAHAHPGGLHTGASLPAFAVAFALTVGSRCSAGRHGPGGHGRLTIGVQPLGPVSTGQFTSLRAGSRPSATRRPPDRTASSRGQAPGTWFFGAIRLSRCARSQSSATSRSTSSRARPQRVGGGTFHAGRALRLLHTPARLVTKCATADRARLLPPVAALGLPISSHGGDSTVTFGMHYDGDVRTMEVLALGDPWTPEEARGWVQDALARVEWVHVAPLLRSDFPAETLRELARGRRLSYDAQGLVRPSRTGPLVLDDDYDPEVLRYVSVLKLADDEAARSSAASRAWPTWWSSACRRCSSPRAPAACSSSRRTDRARPGPAARGRRRPDRGRRRLLGRVPLRTERRPRARPLGASRRRARRPADRRARSRAG